MGVDGLLPLLAPLLALFLVRKLLKSLGLGDLMKMSSAAFLPAAGALKMGGGSESAFGKGMRDTWFGKKDANGNPAKKGIADRLGLSRADKAIEKIGQAGVEKSKQAAKSGGKAVLGRDGWAGRRTGLYERKDNLLGRRDADGNRVQRGMLQRAAHLRSLQMAARNATVFGVKVLPTGSKADRLLNKLTTGQSGELSETSMKNLTGRKARRLQAAEQDELLRQSNRERRLDKRRDRKADRAERDGERRGLSQRRRERAADRLLAYEDDHLRRTIEGYDGQPVILSNDDQADARARYAREHQFRADNVIASMEGHAPLPNAALFSGRTSGVIPQDTDEGTVEWARHPVNYFEPQIRERRLNEDDSDWTRRMVAYGVATGTYDPSTGNWADMLAASNIRTDRPSDFSAVVQAARGAANGLQGSILEGIRITVPASVAASVEADLREVKTRVHQRRIEQSQEAREELVPELQESESTVNQGPTQVNQKFSEAQNIVGSISGGSGSSGGLAETNAAIAQLSSILGGAVSEFAKAAQEAGALGAYAQMATISTGTSILPGGRDEAAALVDVVEKLAASQTRLTDEVLRYNTTSEALVGAVQSAMSSGDPEAITEAKANLEQFKSEVSSRMEELTLQTNENVAQMRQAEARERENQEMMQKRFSSISSPRGRVQALGIRESNRMP
jgi:hypothetical protein